MKLVAKNVLKFIFYPLYFASWLCRRDERIYCFGYQKNLFLDNSRYLFEALQGHTPGKQLVWITGSFKTLRKLRRKNYPCHHRWGIRGLYYSLRAKYYVVSVSNSDVNVYTSGGVTVINLWHGTPLKKIGYDITIGPSSKIYHPKNIRQKLMNHILYLGAFITPNYMIAPSAVVRKRFASAFRIKNESILTCGYPRNDYYLFSHNESKPSRQLLSLIEKKKRIILYAPTFRDTDSMATGRNEAFRWKELDKVLGENGAVMIIRLHPLEKQRNISFDQFEHIIDGSIFEDCYSLFCSLDLVITDYSSIYIDALQFDIPLCLLRFDHENYTLFNRDLYEEEELLGDVTYYNGNDVIECIKNQSLYHKSAKYDVLKRKYWEDATGKDSIIFLKKHFFDT